MAHESDLTTGRLIFQTVPEITQFLMGDERSWPAAAEGFGTLVEAVGSTAPSKGAVLEIISDLLGPFSVYPLFASHSHLKDRKGALATIPPPDSKVSDFGRRLSGDPLSYWVTESLSEIVGDPLFLDLIRKGSEALNRLYFEPEYLDPDRVVPETTAGPGLLSQGYLEPEPRGINARAAWSLRVRGEGIQLGDIERTWLTSHQDLPSNRIKLIHGENDKGHRRIYCRRHGTNVLGVVAARKNSVGVTGIAHNAKKILLSSRLRERNWSHVSSAIKALRSPGCLKKGDILLIEVQTRTQHPVEVVPDVFDEIRNAVDAGIVVIEAAGNRGRSLNRPPRNVLYLATGPAGCYTEAEDVVAPINPNHHDSGAIMVGAANIPDETPTAPNPRPRGRRSNYGKRINCYSWGKHVATTGFPKGADRPNDREDCATGYEENFGGTSAAAAIIAGVAVLTQQMFKRARGRVATPEEIRDLLSNPDLGTSSGEDSIGEMPDLGLIANHLGLLDGVSVNL